MHAAKSRRKYLIVGATLALVLLAGTAQAQKTVFSGKVTSAGTPLGGASVGIPELGVGAFTSQDGRYNFTLDAAKYRGRTVNVTARDIGFRPKTMQVVVSGGAVAKDFDLEKDVLNLDQVVVTGVSGATSQKMTAFAVTGVDASQIKDRPGTSPIASLNGKVAGASVVTTSGQPGSAPSIRLRAPTSISGSTDPLIIVDGTITRMTLADVSSEDIERVEVIKGAAAASLYGSDAANGVVQIFTKRGAALAEGQTYFTFRNEYGNSSLPRKLAGNMSNPFKLNADGSFALDGSGNRVYRDDQLSVSPYPVYYDQMDQVFHTGQFYTNYASIGQRKGSTNFNASFENTHETGVLDLLHGFSRQNFRINVDHAVNDKVDVSTGAFYGRSVADQGEDTGIFFGLRFLEPNINLLAPNKDGTPYNAVIKQPPMSGNITNPLYGLSQRSISNGRDRFTGTTKIRYRPLTWLTAEGNFNYDVANQNYKNLRPLGFLNSAGAKDKGALYESEANDRAYNTGVTVTAVNSWLGWINNTTKAAYVYEDQADNSLSVNATALTVPHVPEFAAASNDPTTPVQPGSHSQILRAKNAFLVTTFELKDRYILDGVIRSDKSSLFGSKERNQQYHRLSAAYRLSEDFHIPGVNELKLRASVGTAGLRPQFDAQYETLNMVAGSPQKATLGNANLKPAFSTEKEYGFNLNFLKNYTVEYSYSTKVTTDQILNVPLSAATGYQSQWQNAGTLAGNSHEIAFGALLVATQDYNWKLNIAGDRTRSTITALKVPPFLNGPDGNTQFFRVAPGETFGVIYGEKWIRTPAQLATTIASGKLGANAVASNYVQNEEGFYVLASAKGTLAERPLKQYLASGTSLQQIGDVNPDFNLSFNNSMSWKNVSLSALVNWVRGGNIYNLTRQWPFNELRDPVFDQRGKPASAQKPVAYYQTFYNGINANDYFVENGGYVRLRELNLSVGLPKSWAHGLHLGDIETARLGVVGRNLWTSTKYSGYDPDVTGAGKPFAFRVDNFSYPPSRTITVMLELGY